MKKNIFGERLERIKKKREFKVEANKRLKLKRALEESEKGENDEPSK